MNRTEILTAANACITVDRAATHGDAEESFTLISGLWSVYLNRPLCAHDVAMMMVLFKVARINGNPSHNDSYVDLAGYGALAG